MFEDRIVLIMTALGHCAAGDASSARAAADALSARQPPLTPRAEVPAASKFAIYRRDQFTCRYCGERTIIEPALRYLSATCPDLMPYDPYWRRNATHPLIRWSPGRLITWCPSREAGRTRSRIWSRRAAAATIQKATCRSRSSDGGSDQLATSRGMDSWDCSWRRWPHSQFAD